MTDIEFANALWALVSEARGTLTDTQIRDELTLLAVTYWRPVDLPDVVLTDAEFGAIKDELDTVWAEATGT